jgi:hypothetical protein
MLKKYFDDLTSDLNRESLRIREYFKTHHPSAGANRENLIAGLLRQHVLPSVGVETGLLLSAGGEYSNQSDIVLIDRLSNSALHGTHPIPLWLVEAAFGVVEVKTKLTKANLLQCVAQSRKFKSLPRNFVADNDRQKITQSLFCVWAFEGPPPERLKSWMEELVGEIDVGLRPDFIIIPGQYLYYGGDYYQLAKFGQPNSPHRRQLMGGNVGTPAMNSSVMVLGDNTVTAFIHWLNSWLYHAGLRRADIVKYFPETMNWGRTI